MKPKDRRRYPCCAAMISAVLPSVAALFTFAPVSKRCFAAAKSPDEADKVLAPAPSGESMRLSEPKRDFLRCIAGGFRVLFACSYAADEIGEGVDDGDDEDAEMKYIHVNLLSVGKSMIGAQRYWFSECKLDELRFAAMISGSADSSWRRRGSCRGSYAPSRLLAGKRRNRT